MTIVQRAVLLTAGAAVLGSYHQLGATVEARVHPDGRCPLFVLLPFTTT